MFRTISTARWITCVCVTAAAACSGPSAPATTDGGIEGGGFSLADAAAASVDGAARADGSVAEGGVATCGAVTVDGKLDEPGWDLSTSATSVVVGSSSNTVHFGTLQDKSHVYVGLKVADAVFRPSTTTDLWNGDAVEIFVDPTDAKAGAYGPTVRHFVIGGVPTSLTEAGGHTTGVTFGLTPIAGGYEVEIGIPLANLGLSAVAGTSVGFDVANDDDDTGAGRTAQIVWAGTAYDYQSTAAFGDVTFDASGCAGHPHDGRSADAGAVDGSAPDASVTGAFAVGTNGHHDQGGPYTAIPIAQQFDDIVTLLGAQHGPIWLRDGDPNDPHGFLAAAKAKGITATNMVCAYPPWTSLADETAAYDWAYQASQVVVQARPEGELFEVGNEWNIQQPLLGQLAANAGMLASDWTSLADYSKHRGAMAGAIAAFKDYASPGARIVGSANAGWVFNGYAVALAHDLAAYKTPGGQVRDLMWDYTCLHWYANMGMPDSFTSSKYDAYTTLKVTGRPLAITEFGADGNAPDDATQAQQIVSLLDNFEAHRATTATEPGIAGIIHYELYPIGGSPQWFEYTVSGTTRTLAPQGQAMQSWMMTHN